MAHTSALILECLGLQLLHESLDEETQMCMTLGVDLQSYIFA